MTTAILCALCFVAGLLIGWKACDRHLYRQTVDALAAMMKAEASEKALRERVRHPSIPPAGRDPGYPPRKAGR